jgi:S-adenosylmethionine:tRNA ribosyltransferase-isomerase
MITALRVSDRAALPTRPGSLNTLDFQLPPELEASEPPEARGLARDEVRLMVSYRSDDRVVHTQFRDMCW